MVNLKARVKTFYMGHTERVEDYSDDYTEKIEADIYQLKEDIYLDNLHVDFVLAARSYCETSGVPLLDKPIDYEMLGRFVRYALE